MATCKGCCKMGYPLQAGYCGGCRCGTSQTFCKHDRERSWNHSNHVVHKDPAPLLGGLQHDVGASLRDLYPFRRHPKAVCDCTRCKRETRLRRDTGSVLGSPACSSSAPRSGSRGGGASRRSARSPAAAKRGFRPTSSASAASAPRYGGGGGGAREPFPLARQPLSLVGDVDDDDCGAGCGEEDGAYEQARRRAFEQGYLSRDDGGGGGGIEEDEAYRKLMSAFQTIRGAVLEQQEREAATTTSSRGKRRSGGGGGGGGSGLRTYPSPLSEGGGWSAASPPTSAAPLGRGKAPAAAVSPAASNADVSASMASAIAERDRLLRLSTTRQPPRAAATAAANVGEDVFQRPRQPQAAAPEAPRARGAGAIFSAYDGAAARRTPVEPGGGGGGGSGGYGGGGPPRPLDVAREEAWRRRQQQQPRPISPVVGAAATHDAFAAASAAAAAAASASEAEAASEASSAASHEFLELAQAEERAEALAAEREALYGEGSISRRRAEERRSAEAVEAGYPAFPPERQRTGGGGGNEAGGTVTVNVKAVPVEQTVTTTVLRHKTTVEATPVFGEAAVTDASASGDSPSRSPAGLLPSGDAGPPPGVGELSYLLDTEVAMQPSGDAGLTLSVNRTLDLRM